MKYPSRIYAKALVAATTAINLVSGVNRKEDLAANFLRLLKKNGDERKLKKIVDEAERLLADKTGMRKFRVESARPLRSPARRLFKDLIRPKDIVEERINPHLIAGIKLVINDDMQVDMSLRRKLDKIFS